MILGRSTTIVVPDGDSPGGSQISTVLGFLWLYS